MKTSILRFACWTMPALIRRWLWAQWQNQPYIPPVGSIRFGDLRRVTPISRSWGYDRGLPIDRYYIERFLDAHREDIFGHVLEVGDATYTHWFGGERVSQSDVLHVVEGNPHASIVADLTHAKNIPTNTFDCIILTQTLQFIFDVPAAIRTIWRILKPGGVLLATFPGISHIGRREEKESWGSRWHWNFTTLSAQRLFESAFPRQHLHIAACGNVLAAMAFLQGLASQELRPEELDYRDADYDLLITVRAQKQGESS